MADRHTPPVSAFKVAEEFQRAGREERERQQQSDVERTTVERRGKPG
jgi:hypothetical protein